MSHTAIPTYLRPAPGWKRFLFSPVLGLLTFYANRRFHRRGAWYEIKDRVLAQYGTPDGCDLQVLPPAECWSCEKGVPRNCAEGSVRYIGTLIRCARCDGDGNYTPERYVRLERRRLGRFVFHTPTGTAYHVALMHQDVEYWKRQWSPRAVIEGYITHPQTRFSKRLGYNARIVLETLFDFKVFGPHLLRRVFHRPIAWWEYHARLWEYGCHPLQRWWYTEEQWQANWLDMQDDELPF